MTRTAKVVPPPLNLGAGLAAYRPLVEQFDQATPILTLGVGERSYATACSRDSLITLAQRVALQILPPVNWAMYSSEVWIKSYAGNEQEARQQHAETHYGDLAKAHDAGDGTVGEAVVCVCWSRTGEVFSGTQSFMRTSEGVIWGEPEESTGIVSDGVVIDAMRDLCAVTG